MRCHTDGVQGVWHENCNRLLRSKTRSEKKGLLHTLGTKAKRLNAKAAGLEAITKGDKASEWAE